ncbi:P1 family peptidase [bacterium]|nr:P1 family peptidase [bacterium]
MSERLRNWGVSIGTQPTGRLNAITDVPGVRVGHAEVVFGEGRCAPGQGPARTGVTAIWPADGHLFDSKVAAAVHVINGFGKTTGLMQLAELGSIETPILITNTLNVGRCFDALVDYLAFYAKWDFVSINPIVMECNDSFLNDILGRHVHAEHVRKALDQATTENAAEGNVGAGTGMSCYHFKGGMGTASRKLEIAGSTFHLGSLVCANMGRMEDLRIDGVPVGRELAKHPDDAPEQGSIIMLLATDAPLDSRQLARLAKRATHGLARTGTYSGSGSGDVVVAWSASHRIPRQSEAPYVEGPRWLDTHLEPLFRAAADTTEEAILNALWAAEPMTGRDGNSRPAIPKPRVRGIMRRAGYAFREGEDA